MDRKGEIEGGRLPLSKPVARLAACIYLAVREDRRAMGDGGRSGSRRLQHASHAANESDADLLQADEESASGPVAARSLEVGKYSQVPWDRGR